MGEQSWGALLLHTPCVPAMSLRLLSLQRPEGVPGWHGPGLQLAAQGQAYLSGALGVGAPKPALTDARLCRDPGQPQIQDHTPDVEHTADLRGQGRSETMQRPAHRPGPGQDAEPQGHFFCV